MYISRIWGEKNPERIEPKFCLVVDVRDVITWFKFGDDRLRGLGSAEGQSLPFPIDFDGRPYNTLTLPCERVILNSAEPNTTCKATYGPGSQGPCKHLVGSGDTPPQPTRGSGERRELPQRGPGRSPGRQRILGIFQRLRSLLAEGF